MKIKDYLHSDLLHEKSNDQVFQKTYDLIQEMTDKLTKTELAYYKNWDDDFVREITTKNAKYFQKNVCDLVNYTIENFKK
jgi:hypothetical protein